MEESNPTLKTLIHNLRSDKVKDRQQGLAQLRSTFANDRAVTNLPIKERKSVWLTIFEALFGAFGKEKAACHKKGLLHAGARAGGPGATALRRLEEVASAVRWFVERVVHTMTSSVTRLVLHHLYRNIRYDGKLLPGVALDYVKSIKSIVSWRPHLDHLEAETWIELVELSFNVILDDPFTMRLEDPLDSTAAPLDVVEESEYSAGDEEAHDSDAFRTPRKRRRRETERTPLSKVATSSRLQASVPVTLEKIEFTSLLAILLRSSSSPIIYQTFPKTGSGESREVLDSSYLPGAILDRLRRFLIQYPADTSLHHDYLLALSGVLSQVALNESQLTVDFARAAWPALAGMWGAKNQRLKEDLVIVLRKLFPFLLSRQNDVGDYIEGPHKLWEIFKAEGLGRWGADNLSLDSLRLGILAEDGAASTRVFAAQTFQHGWHFDPGQALAWAILELLADCARKVRAYGL